MCKYPFKWKFIFSLPFLCVLFRFHFSTEREKKKQKAFFPDFLLFQSRWCNSIGCANSVHRRHFFPFLHSTCTKCCTPGLNSVKSASVWKAVKWAYGITLHFITLFCKKSSENDKNEKSTKKKNKSGKKTQVRLHTYTHSTRHSISCCLLECNEKNIHNFVSVKWWISHI